MPIVLNMWRKTGVISSCLSRVSGLLPLPVSGEPPVPLLHVRGCHEGGGRPQCQQEDVSIRDVQQWVLSIRFHKLVHEKIKLTENEGVLCLSVYFISKLIQRFLITLSPYHNYSQKSAAHYIWTYWNWQAIKNQRTT